MESRHLGGVSRRNVRVEHVGRVDGWWDEADIVGINNLVKQISDSFHANSQRPRRSAALPFSRGARYYGRSLQRAGRPLSQCCRVQRAGRPLSQCAPRATCSPSRHAPVGGLCDSGSRGAPPAPPQSSPRRLWCLRSWLTLTFSSPPIEPPFKLWPLRPSIITSLIIFVFYFRHISNAFPGQVTSLLIMLPCKRLIFRRKLQPQQGVSILFRKLSACSL